MPIYEFRCAECAHQFEELCKSATEKVPCPKCGSQQTNRLFSPFAVSGGGRTSSAGGCGGCAGGHCSTCH
ncbi:MAG: zinc ribbon domain-containing protein [Firmicutes bacterium]|nr:zinc ribbon domain-containing protein [Bacillota bacterium]